MNKNVLLVLAAVVIVGLGLFMFMGSDKDDKSAKKSTNETSQAANEESQQVEDQPVAKSGDSVAISYTDDGFEPENVTIEAGASVIFVNNSSRSMWVASDDHPTHTDMPEFDEKQGIEPGKSYEFTFDEVGEWGYHDHLRSSEGGVVTVQ